MPEAAPARPLITPLPPRGAVGYRLTVVTLLGFASGLPLALTGQAMQAWMSLEGIDRKSVV